MQLSFIKFPSLQALAALIAGVLLGTLLGGIHPPNPLTQAIEQGCEVAGTLALVGLRALAIPLVLSSIVLGGAGLEAMRTMPKLLGKVSAWMVITSLLTVLVAFVVAWCAGPTPTIAQFYAGRVGISPYAPEAAIWVWGWTALVAVSLGLGYYRNQLDDGHGKLFARFCQSLDGMVSPLLRLTQPLAASAIFFLALVATAQQISLWQADADDASGVAVFLRERGLLVILTAGAVYLVALSLVVWVKIRIGPHRYFPALVPAMLLAGAGLSIEATLPLTMEKMRRRLGVSNRVASAVLPLGAVLHRDGVALLWTAATLVLSYPRLAPVDWTPLIAIGIVALTLGCGGHALSGQRGLAAALFIGVNGGGSTPASSLVLGWLVVSLGSAISVFSQTCATLVIARSEGEFWVPGPPPDPEELQGLKTDLALTDS